MYKLITKDLLGNIIDVRHLMRKPTETQLDLYFYEMVGKFETFLIVQIDTIKYAEMSGL